MGSNFAEGLDLKGDYLTQVHIHKIAFPPVTDPVIVTGRGMVKITETLSFEVQSHRAHHLILIQQAGRLIRCSHIVW